MGTETRISVGTVGEAARGADQAQWWERRRTRLRPLGRLEFSLTGCAGKHRTI